jgi:hypothetical protein
MISSKNSLTANRRNEMSAVLAEFATYAIKYVILLAVAVIGFIAGKAYRKNKDAKTEAEQSK